MATRPFTTRHMVALALLMGGGVAGNLLGISFFFGVDWLFGSIATMIIIRLFGAGWGVAASLMISAYTQTLWGHPLGMVTFVLEAVVVGLLAEWFKETSLLLLDGLFWIVVALPFTWFSYTTLLPVDATGTILIFLKQSVNGLFNALVAVLAATHLPLGRWFLGEERRSRFRVGEALFNLLVACLMLPALGSILMVSRHAVHEMNREIETLLTSQTRHALVKISDWRDQGHLAVAILAGTVSQEVILPSSQLNSGLATLLSSNPSLLRMSVLSPDGRVIATDSKQGTGGPTTLGLTEPRPHAGIRENLLAPDFPVVTINQPVLWMDRWVGDVHATLDPRQIGNELRESGQPFPIHLTLRDQAGRVLATSRSDLPLLEPYAPEGTEFVQAGAHRYTRHPATPAPAINRWRESYEVLESPVPGPGEWSLVAEVALAPYRARLYNVYNENLFAVLALIIGALLLSSLVSGWISRPLLQLTTITRYLPQRLKGGQEITWPSSPVSEIDSLASDIRRMAGALRERFDEMEQEASQQRALLSAAIESLDLPVMIADEQERVVYVNLLFLKTFGYSPDEILGRRPAFLRAPETDRRAVEAIRQAIRGGHRVTVELVYRHREGGLIDTELVLSPLQTPGGKITHFVGIYRHVSARAATQQIKSEVRVRATFPVTRPSGTEPKAGASGGRLLLYAEPPAVELVAPTLQAAGFGFTCVQSSKTAWDALSTRQYSTLLLDPQAPGALEFLQDVRQSLRFVDLPVVIMGRLEAAADGFLFQADPRDAARFEEALQAAYNCTA